ncbi:MAG: hypothetical protein ACM31G_04030, partial [Flavobacteriales bacterium]
MINKTFALAVFEVNLDRTNMLITAMEKIKACNRIYQFKAYEENLQYGKIVEEVQGNELAKIEQSCSEHAVISIATIFETFIKEFVPELLIKNEEFFLNNKTKYTDTIEQLIKESNYYTYEEIEKK